MNMINHRGREGGLVKPEKRHVKMLLFQNRFGLNGHIWRSLFSQGMGFGDLELNQLASENLGLESTFLFG